MFVETADKMLQTTNNVKDERYTVRRPSVSENEDHQRGKIDMLSMYNATERLATVGEVRRSSEISKRDAV